MRPGVFLVGVPSMPSCEALARAEALAELPEEHRELERLVEQLN